MEAEEHRGDRRTQREAEEGRAKPKMAEESRGRQVRKQIIAPLGALFSFSSDKIATAGRGGGDGVQFMRSV